MRHKVWVSTLILAGILAAGCGALQKGKPRDGQAPSGSETLQAGLAQSFPTRKVKKVIINGCGGDTLNEEMQVKLRETLADVRGLEHAEVAKGVILVYYFTDMTDFNAIRGVIEQAGCPVTDYKEIENAIDYKPLVYTVTMEVTGLDCPDCRARAESALKNLTGVLDLKLAEDGKAILVIDGHMMGPKTILRALKKVGFDAVNVESLTS